MLAAKNVSLQIGGKWLVYDVSLEVKTGEFVVLVGANGAGKTTLLRLMAGELQPTQGHILLDDKPIRNYQLRELALRRSVMRQHVEMNFDFSVAQIVHMGRHPHTGKTTRAMDEAIVAETLGVTKTLALQERIYTTLSGGEKARVTLARILAQQTQYMLLDEPTSAMDLQHQQLTMQIARKHVNENGGVLAILHDLNLASLYADRVGMMREGRIFTIGSPDEVFTPENILAVFGVPVYVIPHPDLGVPLVIPLHSENLS